MSTKFRQSFACFCGKCRTTPKRPRSSAALFCKEYGMRPMLISVNRGSVGGTISTTGRLSYQHSNVSQLQEKKLLLAENTPTPVTAPAIDTTKFIFPS